MGDIVDIITEAETLASIQLHLHVEHTGCVGRLKAACRISVCPDYVALQLDMKSVSSQFNWCCILNEQDAVTPANRVQHAVLNSKVSQQVQHAVCRTQHTTEY